MEFPTSVYRPTSQGCPFDYRTTDIQEHCPGPVDGEIVATDGTASGKPTWQYGSEQSGPFQSDRGPVSFLHGGCPRRSLDDADQKDGGYGRNDLSGIAALRRDRMPWIDQRQQQEAPEASTIQRSLHIQQRQRVRGMAELGLRHDIDDGRGGDFGNGTENGNHFEHTEWPSTIEHGKRDERSRRLFRVVQRDDRIFDCPVSDVPLVQGRRVDESPSDAFSRW